MTLPKELAELQRRVRQVAAEYKLDFFETVFELVDWAQMNTVAAYDGFPIRYPHWRFGMVYDQISKSYGWGFSKIYELVINNDPCYAYLLKGNSLVDQKLVMGTAPVAGRDHGLVDIAVIGGGINGAGIARDAAGRGLKVLLCEKDDFAEGTSSRSGKLIHGGLRYLEYYEFRLVREALIEREVLLASAPHIIWPMRFVLPHSPEQRPAWLVRTGLLLYDHLGGRKQLPASRSLDLSRAPEGAPLEQQFRRGFEYSDCWVDDSRLVILNLIDAAQNGACILPRTRAVRARRDGEVWLLEMQVFVHGEKDNFGCWPVRQNRLRSFQPGAVGQHDVHEYDVGFEVVGRCNRFTHRPSLPDYVKVRLSA